MLPNCRPFSALSDKERQYRNVDFVLGEALRVLRWAKLIYPLVPHDTLPKSADEFVTRSNKYDR